MGTFTNIEGPNEMLHFATFHQGSALIVKAKKIFRQNNTIFFKTTT